MKHNTTIDPNTISIVQARVASLQATANRHRKASEGSHDTLHATRDLKRGLEALMTAQNAEVRAVKHGH